MNNTFPTAGPIVATIDVAAGEIQVNASDRDDCVAIVNPRDEQNPADVQAAQNVQVSFADNKLTVRSTKTWGRLISRSEGSVRVQVEVPTASGVIAHTGVGPIVTEGELGDASVRTGMGDIRLDQVAALSAKTGFGDVFADHIGGEATVKTSTGVITLGTVVGRATVKNSNGIIEIAECGSESHIRTASGDVTVGRALASLTIGSAAGDIAVNEVSTGAVTIRTGAGAIAIGVREGVAAWLQVASRFGMVRTGLDVASSPESSDSTVEVHARTAAGDITIDRAVA